jgi:carboxymethylenebutenolidase
MKTEAIVEPALTPAQRALSDLWDEHVRSEFVAKDAGAAVDTMVPDAYVNHVPVLTGGVGREQVEEFYANHFIAHMPSDVEIVPVSRTIGSDRVVDELILRFTHSIEMDWMLPGVAATGKRIECATVAIVTFREGKMLSEHIYWDQASVLVQLGLLDASTLPVAGAVTARKVMDHTLPSNQLMARTTTTLPRRGQS